MIRIADEAAQRIADPEFDAPTPSAVCIPE
jgi:hypothetical protein